MKKLIIVLVVIIVSSCNKEKIDKNDYLIFGHFYGECIGETCVETYKLTNDKLYEDQNDNYNPTSFDFIELDDDKFDEVNDLISYIPNSLVQEDDQTFGSPDSHDQGGLYISYYNEGDLKTWRIDQEKTDIPNYLHDFMDKVNEKISLINN